MVMPVIFTRDSGRLARDEFLVIFKGARTSIHVHICNCVLFGHCIALRNTTALHCAILLRSLRGVFSVLH